MLAAEVASLEVSLLERFHGFFRSLLGSPSQEVGVVALLAGRDIRSTLGSNLTLLRNKTGLDPWAVGKGQLKAALERSTRKEVLTARLQVHYLVVLVEEERITTLIASLIAD